MTVKEFVEFCGFPHRRGGVPLALDVTVPVWLFSPQAWGCTVAKVNGGKRWVVFPTGVGVYRS